MSAGESTEGGVTRPGSARVPGGRSLTRMDVGGQDTNVDLTQEQLTEVQTSDVSFTTPKK